MNASNQEVTNFAQAHETSEEIVIAIFEASQSSQQAQEIWENGQDGIVERAFELTDEDELFWGDSVFNREGV